MKTINFITTMEQDNDEKLNIWDYTIIYYDEKNNLIKRALCDYHGTFVDNSNLEEALNSKSVVVYRNVNRKRISSIKTPVIMLTLEDDVVIDVNYNGKPVNLLANRIDTKTLIKRLK